MGYSIRMSLLWSFFTAMQIVQLIMREPRHSLFGGAFSCLLVAGGEFGIVCSSRRVWARVNKGCHAFGSRRHRVGWFNRKSRPEWHSMSAPRFKPEDEER